LDYLLWGKDLTYEGPLVDGYQANEYSQIAVILAQWLMESYVSLDVARSLPAITGLYQRRGLALFAKEFLTKAVAVKLIVDDSLADTAAAAAQTLAGVITDGLFRSVEESAALSVDPQLVGACCGLIKSTARVLGIMQDLSLRAGAVGTALNARQSSARPL
jgi:hypothetical protein